MFAALLTNLLLQNWVSCVLIDDKMCRFHGVVQKFIDIEVRHYIGFPNQNRNVSIESAYIYAVRSQWVGTINSQSPYIGDLH